MQINEKALEAAASAIDTSWSEDGTNRDYPFPETEKSYQDHCRATAQAAIRAYIEAATPPDVAGLLERLDNAATDWRDLKDSENADLLTEAATALRLSAGGGVPEGWKLVPVDPTPEMLGAFWRQKNCGTQEVGERGPHTDDCSAYRAMLAASPTVEAGHVE